MPRSGNIPLPFSPPASGGERVYVRRTEAARRRHVGISNE